MPDQPLRVPVGQLQAAPTVTVPVGQLQAAPTSAPAPDAQGGGFFSRLFGEVNPFPALLKANTEAAAVIQTALAGEFAKAGSRALDDLKGLAHATGTAQAVPFQKGMENLRKGDVGTATRNFADWLLPLAGPRLDEAADLAQQGKYGESAGVATGTAVNFLGPEAVSQIAQFRRANAALTPPSPATDAVRFARDHQIPMTVGQANGNAVARGVEQLNERTSIGGSIVAKGAREKQAAALTRTGQAIADQVHPVPVVPEQAGQAVREAVTAKAAGYDTAADAAYAKLRAAEAAQAQRIAKAGGLRSPSATGAPFTTVPLAVDVAPTKAAMRPVYDALLRKKQLVGSLMGDEARALSRLDALMQAPDLAPLSTADAALSDLKSLSRVDQTFRRTAGQAVAADAVKNLDAAVRSTAKAAGPDVFNALMDGRAATVNKFKTIDVLDTLRAEPVGIFRQATYAKDAGIAQLRELARVAPNEMAKIGRAWLDDALATATAEGGFDHAQQLAADWQNMGAQTKQLLFRDPQRIKALDNFFLFAKKANGTVNASGSAFVGTLSAKGIYTILNPVTGVPLEIAQTALAKALWEPRVVNLLTKALRTPTTATVTSRVVATDALRALGVSNAAVGHALIPAPAGAQEAPGSAGQR